MVVRSREDVFAIQSMIIRQVLQDVFSVDAYGVRRENRDVSVGRSVELSLYESGIGLWDVETGAKGFQDNEYNARSSVLVQVRMLLLFVWCHIQKSGYDDGSCIPETVANSRPTR